MADDAGGDGGDPGAQTVALRLIAAVLIVGATSMLTGLLIPFILALVLAIALAPAADWLGRRGVPKTIADLLCLLLVAGTILGTVGLLIFEAGTIVRDSDKYLARFGKVLAEGAERTGGDRVLESLGWKESDRGEDGAGAEAEGSEGGTREGRAAADRYWDDYLKTNARALGRWVASGLGGMVGFVGGFVVFLAFLFYMLQTRGEWIERLTLATARLGLRPRQSELARIQREIETYIGCLGLVSLGYMVFVSLILWLVGVPQPLLWGVLAGLMEFIPYFGPLIAAVLPTIVSLSLGTWWQPAAVIGQYVALHTFESYVVTPLLYGNAIKIDPVTILFGVLFFGWIWGPLGLAVAMPVMILLRGLLAITPDTPALDALVEPESEEKPAPAAT